MALPPSNPHKKGEHVFNDIPGSMENALESVPTAERVKSVALVQRFGPLRLADLAQTSASLDRLRRESVLIQARTVVAPATGLHNDANSKNYSQARLRLEAALMDVVVNTGSLIWEKKTEAKQLISGV
jgi:hypothetical protein